MKNIVDIEGVGEVYAKKLTEAGIKSVEQLLEARAARSWPRSPGFPRHFCSAG